jgi:hypothetical protein
MVLKPSLHEHLLVRLEDTLDLAKFDGTEAEVRSERNGPAPEFRRPVVPIDVHVREFVGLVPGLALTACAKSAAVVGEAGQKLTLYKPSAVTLHRGGTAKSDVRTKRDELSGDVAIRFAGLPSGVDVVDADDKIVGDQGARTLRSRSAPHLRRSGRPLSGNASTSS